MNNSDSAEPEIGIKGEILHDWLGKRPGKGLGIFFGQPIFKNLHL